MANPQHLKILTQGVEAWNEWRKKNPGIQPDLFEANLSGAILECVNFYGANLDQAILRQANLAFADLRATNLLGAKLECANLGMADLRRANLCGAKLNEADLWKANLSTADLDRTDFYKADLREADLRRADLTFANLNEANLAGAYLHEAILAHSQLVNTDLDKALLYETFFVDTDLSKVKNLDTIKHYTSCTVDHRTLAKSGNLPLAFLRGIGLPDSFIEYISSLLNEPLQFYTCFISYSHQDEDFAKRLHADLQDNGVRCWFAPEDMKIGDKIRHAIDESIRVYDKLLLILSAHSVQSSWVEHEVEAALDKGTEQSLSLYCFRQKMNMYLFMALAPIAGFVSLSTSFWYSGLSIPHLEHGGTAGPVLGPMAGEHLKLGTPKSAVPPATAPTHPLLLKTQSFDTPPPQTSLQHFIQHLADSLHAEISVAFRDLETGKEFFFNERKMMHAASTMKVPVMIEVFRQAEKGKFDLDDSITVKNQFASIVDGSPYHLNAGDDSDSLMYDAIDKKMAIRQLVEQMITVSSNLATNLLIELIGAENVTATLRELGIKHMQVRRGVEDIKAYQRGWNNQTDAFDLMLTLQRIAEKQVASPAACDSMLAILQRQKFCDAIPSGLPAGTIVGNKTGSITKIAHDAAIVFPKSEFDKTPATARKPYVLVVLSRGIQEEKSANRIIAAISRKIYLGLMASL
ncbi:MAG: serine hydrolase [candidate division KSB1 bacterium]|nr:serine hydrolase [candidate division KSB1 bacterium]MDZ7368932.1 serine hydrolase [candidate division KSB1 bacterium]MDZ7406920.1 serine hydrolase [candidate division KSB1 bacterium]